MAIIEIVSPGNKNNRHGLRAFVRKASDLLWQGMVESIQIAIVSTAFGIALSLPLGLLAARNLFSHRAFGGEVHVDGGINRETAEFAGGLGVDILVVGSVLWIKGRDMGREIRLVRALADEGYQYRLNDGVPPIPRDKMVTFTQLPRHLAMKFMQEIEKGGIPVVPLRGSGQWNPDGDRDMDLLVPATVEQLTEVRHEAAREKYLAEAAAWREAYAAEHGWKDPPKLP